MEHSYLWGLTEKKGTCFLNESKRPRMYGCALWCSQIGYSSFFEHYNRILLGDRVPGPYSVILRTCAGQTHSYVIRAQPRLDSNMRFSCPTLDVLLYRVLRVSQQLCQESVCNPVVLTLTPLQNVLCLVSSIYAVQIVCACALRTSFLVQRLK